MVALERNLICQKTWAPWDVAYCDNKDLNLKSSSVKLVVIIQNDLVEIITE